MQSQYVWIISKATLFFLFVFLMIAPNALAVSVERNGLKWEAVKYEELYEYFSGLWSNNLSPYAGERIVTTGTIDSCDFSDRPFNLYPPENAYLHWITMRPNNVMDADADNLSVEQKASLWRSVSGFKTASRSCKDYFISIGKGEIFGGGFLIYGFIARIKNKNYFVVKHIEFANYTPGMAGFLNLIPSQSNLNILRNLLGK